MSNIYILGDIHGSYRPIKNFINKIKSKINTIILLGDAGLNYYFNHRDRNTKEKINKYGINIFIIRGNHEERPSICMNKNPDAWYIEKFWGNQVYVENDYPYIKYALDYPSVYNIPIEDKIIKTLVLPGAYSVDKYHRLANNWSWFPQEQCNENEMAVGTILAQSNTWDLVLSHTCPIIYEPTDLFISTVDQATIDKTTERWLGEIEYNLNYKLWTFGHYHALRIYPKYDNKQMIMLFNHVALNINKYFKENEIYNSLVYITKEEQID